MDKLIKIPDPKVVIPFSVLRTTTNPILHKRNTKGQRDNRKYEIIIYLAETANGPNFLFTLFVNLEWGEINNNSK